MLKLATLVSAALLSGAASAKTISLYNATGSKVYVATSEYLEFCAVSWGGRCQEFRKGFFDSGWSEMSPGSYFSFEFRSDACVAVSQGGGDFLAAQRLAGRDFGSVDLGELAVHPTAGFSLFWSTQGDSVRIHDFTVGGRSVATGDAALTSTEAAALLEGAGVQYYKALCVDAQSTQVQL